MWDYFYSTITCHTKEAAIEDTASQTYWWLRHTFMELFWDTNGATKLFYSLGFTWYGSVLTHILTVLTQKLSATSGNTMVFL